MSSDELLQAAMTRPLADRVIMAEALWASIDQRAPGSDCDEQDAIALARRRDAELSSGRMIVRSHEQVMGAAGRMLE